jgi:hypothetical protein
MGATKRIERKYQRIARQTKAAVELSPNELKELFSERTARIVAFSDLNSQRRRWIALAWILDELGSRLPDGSKTAYRDKAKVADAVRCLQAAIGDGHFSRVNPNATSRERLLFLSRSEPFHFITRDEAITISNIGELSHAIDVLVRMWAPRATMEALFTKQEWRPPWWLINASGSFHQTLGASPEEEKTAAPNRKGRKPGRKPKFDWDDAKAFARQQWDIRGPFKNFETGWKGKADLERLVMDYMSRFDEAGGPSDSSLKEHVSRWILEFEAEN